MSFQTFLLLQLVICGMVAGTQSAPANGTADTNSTDTRGRSNRKYDDQQQFVSIPIGYYRPSGQASADSTESDSDASPKYDVPTSFDDFVPSDKRPRESYPPYYASRGESYKNQPPQQMYNWKGDAASDDNSPTWITPSPADMKMMIKFMKAMDGDQTSGAGNDPITGLLSKLTSDPMAALVAAILPVSILLAAVIPTLATLFTNANGSNIPTVTTVATGNSGRKLDENPSLVGSILAAIENFSARSASQPNCLQRSFCEATRGGNSTDFRSIQKSLYKAFTFVDDYWLETLGVKQLMEAMATGNCDQIQCSTSRRMKRFEDPTKDR